MKKKMIRIISLVLVLVFTFSVFPGSQKIVYAGEPQIYMLKNDYITVNVSGKNGGFSIFTVEGNKLVKSDNNKKLLYHNDEYDTSFTSFQVTYPDGKVKEYIFGGNYTFLGLGGNNLTTVKDSTGITSTWTVDNLTFTQRIELKNIGSAEHGMVSISYSVKSARNDVVSVKQRLLLDTSLGEQDYACYEVIDANNISRRIGSEQIIASGDFIPLNFFGYDDPEVPEIIAYTVNSTGSLPYQVAFAHWNNLASTAFDFTPDPNMTFTNKDNLKYQTADSAYALYYDMGTVPAGSSGKQIVTTYGVYSNVSVQDSGKIAVNITSPLSLTLSEDKTKYEKTDSSLPGAATFGIQVQLDNFINDTAKDYDKITVAFYTSNGITPLDGAGNEVIPKPTYLTPYTADFMNFKMGTVKTSNFYFKADVGESASYRRVEVNVFNTSEGGIGSESSLTKENLIGSGTFYVLCPGGSGSLPKITFTGRKPEILYYEGTRHLYITGNNIGMLDGDKSQYSLYAYNRANNNIKYEIESNNILFPEEDVVDIIFTKTMVPGIYDLKFELSDEFAETLGCDKILTSPALTVTMSSDYTYRNNYYGIVAVVQEGTEINAKYLIKSYKNEDAFNKDKTNYEEVLLVFRGEFVEKEDPNSNNDDKKYVATSVKTVDGSGNSTVTNTVTINNCIDFEDGTLSVYYHYENGVPNSVYVDFDGSLYTSDERTSIWKGKAALTEIKNGSEYGLVPYNNGGNNMSNFNENTITLIWPNAYGLGQTLAGMVFKMTYGSLGIMYDTTDTDIIQLTDSTPVLGYVLSFSAALDLGFLIPKSQKAKEDDKPLDVDTELYWLSKDPTGELRSLWNHYYEQTKKKQTQTGKEYTKGQASVLVDNILFGCGKGFLGVNFTVDLALPAYIDAMPSITGKLTINTINNWSFGVKGKCEFTKITLEVDLMIKSYKNIPIPDKLYFYVAGFEPGINIDGFGVIWITGGGGGFDNLYDTIFASNGIPPLKLMLSVAFDVFKVLSARADLSLSLRGIGLNVEGVKVKGIDIEIIKKMQLQFDWYPDIYFMAAISASYYAILEGQGYIVIIDNERYKKFFEGFLRGKLKIPSAIPFIGGLELAGIDLGVNTQKIWGSATALGTVNFSIVYYWGGDIDFSLKKNENAQPTFPELLGQERIPVYYDAETGRTMYMSIGNNITVAAMPEIADDIANTPRLLASMPQVYSDLAKEKHIVNAGTYSGVNYAFTITFDAQSLEEARTIAGGFSIRDDSDNPFDLELYDVSANNLTTANANVTFDEGAEKGTLGIVLNKSEYYDKNWNIETTGVLADIVLFEMGELPKVTTMSHTLADDKIDVTWDGIQLDKLDNLSFYLAKDQDPESKEAGELIASFTESNDLTSKNKTLTIPGSLASGNYYLRAVYSQENAVNGVIISDNPISYTNINQPSDPSGVTITNAGDLSFNVNIEGDMNADGYLVSVYEIVDGNPVGTDITNMAFEKEEGVLPQISIGGSYQGFDMDNNPKTYGLLPGKNYRVGVKSYKYVDEDDDGLIEYAIYGNEVLSNVEYLKAATPPDILITEKTPFKLIDEKHWGLDQNGNPAEINVAVETFNVSDIEYLVESPGINVSGSWYVDDFDYSGDFTDTREFSIELLGLGEGMHTLNISGKDADGDSFRVSRVFKVDTLPPRLLLSSPINGSTFSEQGALEISGITDIDAEFTIAVDGETKVSRRSISELNGSINPDGVFSFNINIDPGVSWHKITITASDKSGNRFTREAVVMNSGLSKIKNLSVFADGVQYTNRNLKLNSSGSTAAQLSLAAETENSSFVINDYELVSWSVYTVKGSASVGDDGMLIVAKDSIGYITGEFKVAENASMTASATFGADVYSKPISDYHTLTLGASIGGKVSGSGSYAKGTEVTITAQPSSGYRFVRWKVIGDIPVGIANPTSRQTTIIIPDSDVNIVAEFEYINETGYTDETGEDSEDDKDDKDDEKQELVTLTLDAGEYGTVYGSGSYEKGTEVNISAIPGKGYKFKGWKVIGDVQVTIANPESEQTTVVIPDKDITIIAEFEYVEGGDEIPGEIPGDAKTIMAMAGEKSFIPLETGIDKNRTVVCTLVDGVEQIVQMCAEINGNMYFIAPVEGVYYLKELDVKFTDISGHWAKGYIESAYAKSLFKGISDKLFAPDEYMTRAMFVTVLGRLYGISEDDYNYKEPNFRDVIAGEWYSPYVEWASQNGIILGYGNGYFGTNDEITREQMCVILERYIKFAEYHLPEVDEVIPFSDSGKISSWAVASVNYAQRTGLVIGAGNNLFNPLHKATRAEVATVYDRLITKIIDSIN